MANFEEALAGMRRGEKWRRKGWGSREFWRCRAGEIWSGVSEFRVISFTQDSILGQDWERYEELKRNLSFDEAVKCKQVMIIAPDGYFNGNSRTRHMVKMSGWTAAEISLLDLAERRGWKIEEAE